MKFWHITVKDLIILVRDIPGLIYLFLTPVIVIAVASFALSGLFNAQTTQFKIPIVVEDNGVYSQNMVNELKKVSALKLVESYKDKNGKEQKMTREEAEKQVTSTKAAIIIQAGFSNAITEEKDVKLIVIKDPVDRVIPNIVSETVTKYVNSLLMEKISNTVGIKSVQSMVEKANTQFHVALDPIEEVQNIKELTKKMIDSPSIQVQIQELKSNDVHKATPFDSNVPGYAVMFVLLGTAAAASVLMEERENGTLRKLQTLPISNASILGGKMLSNFITASLQCFILFSIGHFIFGMWLGKSIVGLILIILTTSFASTGLAMMLAAFSKTRSQASGISILLVLTMSALGGSWWPLYIVPDWMQKLAHITLTAWAMDGFNNLLTYSKGLSDVLLPSGVLFGMGLLFLLIAARRFRFQ